MKRLTNPFEIPSGRCTRCRELGDFLAEAERPQLPRPTEEGDALKFECFESFAHLRASATAGCDICRLLHCALTLETPSFLDLMHSTSTVWIRLNSRLADLEILGYSSINVICGELDSLCIEATLWKPSQLLKCFNPRRSWRDAIGKGSHGPARDLELTKAWLTQCLTMHEECRESSPAPTMLPKRLIDIGNVGEPCRLVTGDDAFARQSKGNFRYCALSYCWGRATGSPKLTLRNLDAFTSSLPDELPRTIQDAITITRTLDVRYLWVDALCIVQPMGNDQSEWLQEAARMGEIYSRAVCTISATGAKDSSEGCFIEHEWKTFPLKSCVIPRRGVLSPRPMVLSIPSYGLPKAHSKQVQSYRRGPAATFERRQPLETRAWTLQERCLSQRIIHWTAQGVTWECERHVTSERNSASHGRAMSEAQLVKQRPQWRVGTWMELVVDYSYRELTNPSDKLVALSGLAKLMHRYLENDEYLAGLWRSALLPQLMWSRDVFSEDHDGTREADHELNQSASSWAYVGYNYLAPSWSWASRWYMPIEFLNCLEDRLIPGTAIDHEETYIRILSKDPYGAVVDGQVKLRAMIVDIKTEQSPEEDLGLWCLTEPPVARVSITLDVPSECLQEMTGILLYKAAHEGRHTYLGILMELMDLTGLTQTPTRVFTRKGTFRLDLSECARRYRKPEHYYEWETIIIK